jgi:hypothetical protein
MHKMLYLLFCVFLPLIGILMYMGSMVRSYIFIMSMIFIRYNL